MHDIIKNDILRLLILKGIILYIGWISFIPQPIQVNYQVITRFFLLILLISSVFRKKNSLKLLFDKSDIPLWLFLIGISINIFFTANSKTAIKQYFDLTFPLVLLYYLMKLEICSKNILYIARSICVFSAIVALFGIFECIFRKNFIYEFFIYNQYYDRYIRSSWPRPMSTQLNPAILGTYLVGCLPFSIFLLTKKERFNRWISTLSLILSLIVIILTFSRGAFLGFVIFFLFYFWKKKQTLFIKYFVSFLTIFIMIVSFHTHSPFARFGIKGLLFGNFHTSLFSDYRLLRVFVSLRMFKIHPFVGLGLNNYRINFHTYSPVQEIGDEWKIADNMYLTLLAETGIIGFLVFIIFIGSLLNRGFYFLDIIKAKENKEILTLAISGLIAMLVNMFGYELLYWTTPFSIFCILISIIGALIALENARFKVAPIKNSNTADLNLR